MGRETSVMVIPSFYTSDDEWTSVRTRPAERQLPGGRSQSCGPAGPLLGSSPDQLFLNNHSKRTFHEGNGQDGFARSGENQLSREAPKWPLQREPELDQQTLSGWHESEIITNLFLGDLQDATRFDGMIISVLADAMPAEPRRTIHLPFLANGRATLDSTAALIDAGLRLGMRVLVHCEEGCERAPLVIAWFLTTRRRMSLDEAYGLIKSRRPIVRDRRVWLGLYNR